MLFQLLRFADEPLAKARHKATLTITWEETEKVVEVQF